MDNVAVAVVSSSSLGSLALVLLISGVAKLVSPGTGPSPFTSMPAPFAARWLQSALPWLELVVAIALVLASGVVLWAAASAAVALFAVFTAAVFRGARQPDPASCGCFGSLSRAPMSRRTVVRNLAFTLVAVLALLLVTVGGYDGPVLDLPWFVVVAVAVPAFLALVALWSERPDAPRTADPHSLAGIPPLAGSEYDDAAASPAPVLTASAALHSATVTREAGEHPAAALSAPGAASRAGVAPVPGVTIADRAVPGKGAAPGAVGTTRPTSAPPAPKESDEYVRLPIPYAGLRDATGAAVTLRGLAGTSARALVHVSPGCGACTPVLDHLNGMPGHLGPVAVHAVVATVEDQSLLPSALRAACLMDTDDAVSAVFEYPGDPWVVVLGADGLLAGGPVAGTDAVLELLTELEERFAG